VENFAQFGFGPATSIDIYNPVYDASAVVTPPLGVSFGFPVAPFNNQRVTQTGLYLQDQIRIGGLILTASGRYDWVDLENRTANDTTEQNEFTYRVGANYLFENGFAPYVSYATSFEPVLGTDSVTQRNFEPSTSSQIEAGVKYDGRLLGPDVRVFATAAVYKIEQENLVSVQSGATPQFGTQIGEVEAQGFELEGVARIRDQLTINGAYSYTDTEIVKAGVPAAEGKPLPTTPKHKFSLLVDYTLQRGPLAGLGGGVGVRYLSSSAGSIIDAFNPSIIYSESTTLWDALLHYDLPEWRIALNGSNIFDEEYVGRCASPSGCIYGQARQVMLSVARKF
jgi:iron complex outermembrane recepter protein